MAYEFTNVDRETDTWYVTISNETGSEVTLTYKQDGDADDTEVTIAVDGALDLPECIPDGETIGDVYTKLEAAWGESTVFEPDLTKVITEDTIIYLTNNWTVVEDPGSGDSGFGGLIDGGVFPLNP